MAKGGQLTSLMTTVSEELEAIDQDIRAVLRVLEQQKSEIVNAAVERVATQIDPGRRAFLEQTIERTVDEAFAEIHKARSYVGRINVITKNVIDVAKRVEKTWIDALRDYIRETKWYKETYPAQYEQRQREKEYEQLRQRPEYFYERPLKVDPERRGPRVKDIKLRRRQQSVNRLEKHAQLENVTAAVEDLFKRISTLVQTYFIPPTLILEAANEIAEKIRSKGGRTLSDTKKRALEDQLRILENIFGFEKQPGRYLVSGGRAFLLPAAKKLQDALAMLHRPFQQVGATESIIEQFDTEFGTGPTPAQARMKRILERFGRLEQRQRRCQISDRLASSR